MKRSTWLKLAYNGFALSLIGFTGFVLIVTPHSKFHEVNQSVAHAESEMSQSDSQSIPELIKISAKGSGLSDKQAEQLICIARAESGMRPEATNINKDKTKDIGVFQINTGGTQKVLERIGEKVDTDLLYSPFVNIRAGVQLYKERGPEPWSVYTVHGKCH